MCARVCAHVCSDRYAHTVVPQVMALVLAVDAPGGVLGIVILPAHKEAKGAVKATSQGCVLACEEALVPLACVAQRFHHHAVLNSDVVSSDQVDGRRSIRGGFKC